MQVPNPSRLLTCAVVAAFPFLVPLGPAALAAQDSGQTQPAQDEAQWEVAPRLWTGGGLTVAQPRGEFADYVRAGIGIGGFFRASLDQHGILSLRADLGFMTYGRETQRIPLSETVGTLIEADLTTSNNIVVVGLGPEVGIPVGPVRLYGGGSAGYTYFHTDSELEGTRQDQEPLFRTRNHSDGGFAWSGGGGLQVQVSGGRTPVLVDLGATYHSNGRREYVTRDGIVTDAEGRPDIQTTRSDADFLVWRLGVSVGLRHGQP